MTSRTELPDVNVLVALLQPTHAAHNLAMDWFGSVPAFATTPVTELGLFRLSLNPRVMGHQLSAADALASLRSLKADARAQFIADDTSLAQSTVDLRGLSGHRQVTDLHLINLAIRNGLALATFDRALPASLMPQDLEHLRLLG